MKNASNFGYWVAFLRLRFFRLSFREQALLLLFVLVILVMWVSMQFDRHVATFDQIGLSHRVARNQAATIARGETTQEQFDALIAEIDLESLPSRDAVNGGLDAMVRKYGFQFSMDQPKTDPGTPLSFHTYQMSIKKGGFPQLERFTNELKTALPYVSVRYIKMQADPRDQNAINASFELKSIEYTQ